MCFLSSAAALALVYQTLGQSERARELANGTLSFAIDTRSNNMSSAAQAFQAELALRQGRLAEASRWAMQHQFLKPAAMFYFYDPSITLARILLAQHTRSSQQQAAQVLSQLNGYATTTHNTRGLIDVLAMEALLHDAQGEETVALEKLSESLTLAKPGGFIRNFVDMGPQMADLLTRWKDHKVSSDHVEQILSAFPAPISAPTASRHAEPSEPLTKRELQTLRLLATDLRTEEIAAEMFVTVDTVRTHTKRIFRKLEAHSRSQVVQRAQELGLL